jgi:hypothetical protein
MSARPRSSAEGRRTTRFGARLRTASLLALLAGAALVGCSARDDAAPSQRAAFERPVPRIGRGPAYRLAPAGRRAARGTPIAGLRCREARGGSRFGAHLEVFAEGLDVVVPAGIGVAPPRSREGAYVTGGPCEYPLRTHEPTGLIEIDSGTRATLGQFFAVWGEPLGRRRALGFRAPDGQTVSAFVNGRLWPSDPRQIPLDRHVAIVVEVGGFFPPTRRYLFPEGL